ncbi:hypothetical protein Tco_0421902 [Tanacetum coccineum]
MYQMIDPVILFLPVQSIVSCRGFLIRTSSECSVDPVSGFQVFLQKSVQINAGRPNINSVRPNVNNGRDSLGPNHDLKTALVLKDHRTVNAKGSSTDENGRIRWLYLVVEYLIGAHDSNKDQLEDF